MADNDFTEEGLEDDFETELQQHALDEDGQPATEENVAPVAASDDEEEGEDQGPALLVDDEEKEDEPDKLQARLDHSTAGIRNELKASRQQTAVLERRMGQLLETIAKVGEEEAEAAKPPPPTFDENPEEAIRTMIQDSVEPLVEGQKAQDLEAAQATLDEYANNVQTYVAADRDAFVEQNPDFLEAEKFLVMSEIRNIRLNNPNWTDQQIEQFLISNRFTPMQVNYYRAQASMAEAIYEQAKLFGWQPGGEARARPQGPRSTVSAATMRQRQAKTRTLSQAPRPAARKRITSKDVLNMSDDEYVEWLDGHKNPAKAEEELARRFAVEL